MTLKNYYSELSAGVPLKRKAWKGYWRYKYGTIEMHTKDDKVISLTETEDILFTLSNVLQDDWEVATTANCPVLAKERGVSKR